MENLNQLINSFDSALLLIWLLIGLSWNARAFIVASSLGAYLLIHSVTNTDFETFIICSTLYFIVSSANIKLSSEFRKAFLCFGVVYFIGAIDHFTYSHLHIDTKFDRIQPYLITIINAYVLAYLLGGWRRDNVYGLAHYCAKRLDWYKLHLPSNR